MRSREIEFQNEKAQIVTKQLEGHLITLMKNGDQITVKSDGKFGVGDWGGNGDQAWNTDFSLPKSGTFQRAPDHHINLSFRIEQIDEESVQIFYTYKYSHPGTRGRGTDTGTVTLNYFQDQDPNLKNSW